MQGVQRSHVICKVAGRPALATSAAMDQAAINEIDAAVKAAKAPGAPLVSSINRVFTILRSHKLMLEQQIEPCFIGIHSMNRDGHGIAWKDAERLMEAILDVGFDVGSVIQPTCSERLAGDNDSHVFNERISQESRGRVPPIPDQHLKYLSLSCSHLNTTLRMIAAGAKCSEELSCSENGTISMHKVENKDPTYASYARSGLKWNVISQHVMGKWPELAQLIQAALNTGSAVAKEEHEMQILLRITAKLATGPCQWDQVKQELQRSKPRCMQAMPHMFTFCVLYGSTLLERTCRIVASSNAPRRSLGADFYESLSQQPKPKDSDPWIFFRHALLACAYTTPAEKLISASDARKLTAKGFQDGISKANDLMKEIHSKVASVVPSSKVASIAPLLGLFESQLVYLALDKKHKDITVMSTMEHACLALCKEVHEAIGITLSKQWDHLEDPSGQTGKASAKRLSKPREYDSTGKLKDPFVLLHESGFVPGAWITRKQDKLVAQLLKLENDQIIIECDGDQYAAQMSAFIEGKWKLTDAPKAREEADHVAHAAFNSPELVVAVTKGKIMEKLVDLERQHKASLNKIKVFTKPSKMVEASAEVEKGKLTLVPATNVVQAHNEPKKGLQLGMCGTADIHFSLWAPVGKVIVPWWYVKSTNDTEKANMEIISVLDPHDPNKNLKAPLMKNTKPLEIGDVLMRYEQKTEEVPEALVPMPAAGSAPKRRKTGKGQGQ